MSISKQKARAEHQKINGVYISKLREYKIWAGMCDRCKNPNATRYEQWGGRGIKVCERWLEREGFSNFLKDMGFRPSSKHSLDRIDSNGNYEPSNVRWATPHEQAINKRIGPTNKTGYLGVSYHLATKRYRVKLGSFGKMYHLGTYADPIEAALIYDMAALQFHGNGSTTNFL